jgi:hypothetical protein
MQYERPAQAGCFVSGDSNHVAVIAAEPSTKADNPI